MSKNNNYHLVLKKISTYFSTSGYSRNITNSMYYY
jgi:hypothetical protein